MIIKKAIVLFLFVLLGCVTVFTQSKDSITVNFFLLEDCKICQYYAPTIQQLYDDYNNEYTTFIGYFPNRYSSEKNIATFKEKYNIPFKLKKEFFQTRTQKYNVTVTPEVVVYNETKGEIIYQGRIDNSYAKLGKRRRVVTEHELNEVLDNINKGNEIVVSKTIAIGCLITIVE
jgi:thiol-disulfide isomerase/thioredoxin